MSLDVDQTHTFTLQDLIRVEPPRLAAWLEKLLLMQGQPIECHELFGVLFETLALIVTIVYYR